MRTIVTVGVIALLVIVFLSGMWGHVRTCNEFENGLQAQYDENRNRYDNGYKKVLEIAQVPAIQAKTIKDLYAQLIMGRGGSDTDKALFRAIQEQNPNFDQSTYIKVQQTIEAFRNEFAQRQTEMIARKQSYTNYLTTTLSGMIFNIVMHYPHVDMAKFDIVTSGRTEDAFKTHQDDVLKLPQ